MSFINLFGDGCLIARSGRGIAEDDEPLGRSRWRGCGGMRMEDPPAAVRDQIFKGFARRKPCEFGLEPPERFRSFNRDPAHIRLRGRLPLAIRPDSKRDAPILAVFGECAVASLPKKGKPVGLNCGVAGL